MRRHACLCLLALALAAPSARAASDAHEFFVRTQKEIGDTTAVGARSRGMGGVHAALVNGPGSVQENPAALGAFCDRGVTGDYGVDWLDNGDGTTSRGHFRVGAAASLNTFRPDNASNQAVGVGYKYIGSDQSHRLGSQRLRDDFRQNVLTFGYGSTLGCDFLVGAAVSLFDAKWRYGDDLTTLVDAMDREYVGGELKLGGLWRMDDQFTLGGTLAYAGGTARERLNDTVRENGDFDRWGFRVGASWQLAESTLWSSDFGWSRSKTKFDRSADVDVTSYTVATGLEHQILPESLVIRGGLYYTRDDGKIRGGTVNGHDKTNYWGFTAGAGARVKSVDLNAGLDLRTTGDIGLQGGAQYEW